MDERPSFRLKSLGLSNAPKIVMSEGEDPRIIEGSWQAFQEGLANIILVGNLKSIQGQMALKGASLGEGFEVHDPKDSLQTPKLTQAYFDLRKSKGASQESAIAALQTPLVYAAMLVKSGLAGGTVGGAVHTTSDVVRTALQVIGKAQNADIVSSFFLMLPQKIDQNARAMVYADCGLVINPTSEELASIAAASALSFSTLLSGEAKIAMLSFSTNGSARHKDVDKVIKAVEIIQAQYPELHADGELQFDAAFIPEVGAAKAPQSSVAGHANVMIFPDLDSGNIAYKITQRLGGYLSIGPVLQGLAKPANDLSRGCSSEDVKEMIAVTALQSYALNS